ncbi:MAG: ABC transporter ATP-binding protein [Caldilineaceae bacterium]
MTTAAIEMLDITKRFPGVTANAGVNLRVEKGEIHALLGENGAGKSTLMNILCGLYKPNEGMVFVNGKRVEFNSPSDAISAGIGMVHQHFMLVSSQSVSENVFLGYRGAKFILSPQAMAEEVRKFGKEYELQVDPDAKIWQLSVGEQQRVEIIKVLSRGAEILILDEPTAVLTPQESESLFSTLRHMRSVGKTILLISHKLDEVLSIANRITVLRGGKVAATVDAAGMTKAALARLMVGRDVLFQLNKAATTPGEVKLRLAEVEALDEKRLPALRKFSLTVRAGEIVGIAGVAGNGQRELAEVICGLRPTLAGTIEIAGKPIHDSSPVAMIQSGVAYVPEDRSATGSAPNLSISENLILKAYRKERFGSSLFIDGSAVESNATELIKQYNISTPSSQTPVRKLSGGNLQKVILAREISSQPQILVAAYPTRGLDIGATENVRKILLEQRNNGAAILLISEELDEILSVADRVVVLYEGQNMGEFAAEKADLEKIGLLMAGVH